MINQPNSRSIAILIAIFCCLSVQFIFIALSSLKALADTSCDTADVESILETTVATAAAWSNLRNNPGSLSFESARLLNLATASSVKGQSNRPQVCPAGCRATEQPRKVLRSVPLKFIAEYEEFEQCQVLYQQTKQNPFSYLNRRFKSEATLTDWFQDFSQGKGIDGKDLYSKCPGKCSPQYSYKISKTEADQTINIDATVICGHARDKSDNSYRLSLAAVWSCEPK